MFGFLGNLVGGGIAETAKGVADVIDKFVETPDEKRLALQIKQKMMMQPVLAQVELNKIEAGHRSIFVAGWRPFIGWVCGFALAWHFILFDILSWITLMWKPEITLPQLAGTDTLITVLLAMLGLGGLRTYEKKIGKAK